MQNRFLQSFVAKPKWKVFVKGRLARLEFSGATGRLHVYAIYLSPDDPGKRDEELRRLAEVLGPSVHNILAGDFNFVTNDGDRISKGDGACNSGAADKRNAGKWKGIASKFDLKEFQQEAYTCENSYGWSKIDRVYTNLHTADLCAMRSACNILDHPRHLSDHKPVSLLMSAGGKQAGCRSIPRWVVKHADFKKELLDEHTARCSDFVRERKREPTVVDKLKLFKESAHRTAAYIRRLCDGKLAETIEHKLAIGLSFLRAIHVHN